MIAVAFLILAQAAPPATTPERFSVLARECPPPGDGKPGDGEPSRDKDVVVCADGMSGARLPLPDERQPDGPVPVNPKMDGAGALAAEGTPCAATQKGCTVGVGPPPELIAAAVGAIKDAFAKKPDKSGRVAIDLDAPPPATAGRVLP